MNATTAMRATVLWLRDTQYFPLEKLIAALSAAEKKEFSALNHHERQRNFLLSRALLRQLLSAELPCSPADIAFTRIAASAITNHSRLALAQHPHWHISVSHSHNAIAVMAATAPCGVDIETPRNIHHQKIAARYFSHEENAWLAQQTPANRAHEFYKLWTLKEASVKALHQGLANNLARVAFDISRPTPIATLRQPVESLQARQCLQAPIFLSAAINSAEVFAWEVREFLMSDWQ